MTDTTKGAPRKTAAKTSSGKKPGLYANIQAKHERIAHGSGEHMRKTGEAGAPASDAFEKTAAKKAAGKTTAKKRTTKTTAATNKSADKTTAAKKPAAKRSTRKTSTE